MHRSFSQIQIAQLLGGGGTSKPAANDRKAIFFMVLLAIQYGFQSSLTRAFTSTETIKSTVVLVQEILKFAIAGLMLSLSGGWTKAIPSNWRIVQWLGVAGVPAMLYSFQNICSLTANQHLDGLTFNVLNQTKTLSAALCCYLVMGQRQSRLQIVALLILLLSALTMEGAVGKIVRRLTGDDDNNNDSLTAEDAAKRWALGVLPLLTASFISGLAGALCQRLLQAAGGGRNPYLFSMELCAASALTLLISLFVSGEGQRILDQGFWNGWTLQTMIPIFTNSIGGILVGLVTKFAGSVRKGFALIFGIFLSGIIQARSTPGGTLSTNQLLGGFLAGFALWMHGTNRLKTTTPSVKKEKES